MKTITLRRTRTGWVADFAEADNAAEVQRLFGTTSLPTPFTLQADVDTVIAAIQAHNPGHVVHLGTE